MACIRSAVCLLRQFNHDNVVKFHAFAQTEDHFILVLDFCGMRIAAIVVEYSRIGHNVSGSVLEFNGPC
jgi:hypothetical protein